MVVLRRRWTSADRAASVYQYVPFTVPRGSAGVAVDVAYDRSSAVVDLGLFDPAGFRGYSGGARDRCAVARDSATPGYLPGPVPAGEWQVLLGLHRVPPHGVEVTVSVDPDRPAPPPVEPPVHRAARPPRRDLPAAGDRRWVAGDFHAHTVHSDGDQTVRQLAVEAAAAGLDVLAVTDHNTVSHHAELADAGAEAGVLLVPGQEVTTDSGHANCLGDVGWVDFRRPADDWLAAAVAGGGLLSVNHPRRGGCAWRRRLSAAPHLVEAWHRTWDRTGDEPDALVAAWAAVGVGGSDFHRADLGHRLGSPTTWLEVAELSLEGVLAALAAGRVALAAEPRGPVLLPHDGELVAVGAEGLRLHGGGRAAPVREPRARLRREQAGQRLVDDRGLVHALVAGPPHSAG